MTPAAITSQTRTRQRAVSRARDARRRIGSERQYHCSECGFERRSWVHLRSCPSCGTGLAQVTVVRTILG